MNITLIIYQFFLVFHKDSVLYIIYINDLKTAIKHCNFADDANLLHINDPIEKLNKTVNSDSKN